MECFTWQMWSVNMWLQSLLVCISVSIVKSWILPPKDFLIDFATKHDRTSIIIYLPHQKLPQKWIKNIFVSGSDKIIVPVSFVIPTLVANFSLISTTNEDLHVFLPEDKDNKSMEISIELFTEIYEMRSNSRREHWLLDISYWNGSEEASKDLTELSTDLDDDLYWYTYSNHEIEPLNLTKENQFGIELFEVYKINEDLNMTVNYYGDWSKGVGLRFVEEKKWIRRKNLQVILTNF